MPECPTCGKQLDPSVRFCPDDGTPLTETAAATVNRTPTEKSAAQTKQLELPLLLGNRYRLVEARGGGGMAKVYRAIDVTLEREVAVKLINQELREEAEFDTRFQREARIASQLSDPHIVVVHDFGIDATHGPYLVMEYLQGQTLREYLQANGPLPWRAVLQVSAQLLLALIHAHDKGVIHRDIKPDNIFLLNQSGVRLHVRMLDFGIARIYRRDEAANAVTLTRPGAVLGTPRYMSPEQLAGQALDARSDLYSAALVIYEALTGTLPYVTHKKLSELCPEAPPALQSVLEQCLQQNPAERPASATEVYLRLQNSRQANDGVGTLLAVGPWPGMPDYPRQCQPVRWPFSPRAASQAPAPTVAYVPSLLRGPWSRRRVVLAVAGGALLLLGLATWRIVPWLKRGDVESVPPAESILGLQVGSSRDDVVAQLKRAPDIHRLGDPWKESARQTLGKVLMSEDLGGEASRDKLEMLGWSKEQVVVLLQDNLVRAIVIREPYHAFSGRGLKMGEPEARLVHLYSSEIAAEAPLLVQPVSGKSGAHPSKKGKIYRYDALGIGFEVEKEKITAITLYPPKS